MSTATDYLRMSYREFQQEKRDAPARLLWDAAKAEDGIIALRAAVVLEALPLEVAALELRLAIRRGHLIPVTRHTVDGPPVVVYQPMGERP